MHARLAYVYMGDRKRGKFRPTLMPLLNKNSAKDIKSVTQEVSAFYRSGASTAVNSDRQSNLKRDVKLLCDKLKGAGPALSSYIRAALVSPADTPVFSDEAARWILSGEKGRLDWSMKLGYSMKEYLEFEEGVQKVSGRLQKEFEKEGGNVDEAKDKQLFTAEKVEMVGWVLGKEAQAWVLSNSASGGISLEARDKEPAEEGPSKKDQVEDKPATTSNKKRKAPPSATTTILNPATKPTDTPTPTAKTKSKKPKPTTSPSLPTTTARTTEGPRRSSRRNAGKA